MTKTDIDDESEAVAGNATAHMICYGLYLDVILTSHVLICEMFWRCLNNGCMILD